MVTATASPNVLRVSFLETNTDFQKVEIVCLVEANPHGGLCVHYQQHNSVTRPTGKGPWEEKTTICMTTISPALDACIRTNVRDELFSTFCKTQDVTVGQADRLAAPILT